MLFQAMMVTALLVSGMGVAVLGSIKFPLAKRLQIDEARVGGLVSIFGFILMPVIFTAGFVTDQIGTQAVLMTGTVLFAGGLVLLAQARSYSLALASVLLLGAAWAMMINAANVLTPRAFPGTMAHATNLANVFFGLGAFLTPLGIAFLVERWSLSSALILTAGLVLIPAVLALAVDFGALVPSSASGASAAETPGLGALLGDPLMWLCGMALFFYGPLEASLGAWTTTYLGERGVSDRMAPRLLSAFWLAYMASRLMAAFALPARSETIALFALAVGCVLVLTAMVITRGAMASMVLVVAAGLIFGPVFPTLMAILLGHFDPALHGRAVGLLFAVGGIGWTIIPILIGMVARRSGVQRGFRIAAAAAVCLSAVALMILLR
jgi:fucose permease